MNKFKIFGVIEGIKEFERRNGPKIIGIMITATHGNGKFVNKIPLTVFNNVAKIVLEKYKVGDEVTVCGHAQSVSKEGETIKVQLVVHEIFKGLSESKNHIVKQTFEHKEENPIMVVPVKSDSAIKQISLIDFSVINTFKSAKDAAKFAKVKKSVLDKAINTDQQLGGYLWTK